MRSGRRNEHLDASQPRPRITLRSISERRQAAPERHSPPARRPTQPPGKSRATNHCNQPAQTADLAVSQCAPRYGPNHPPLNPAGAENGRSRSPDRRPRVGTEHPTRNPTNHPDPAACCRWKMFLTSAHPGWRMLRTGCGLANDRYAVVSNPTLSSVDVNEEPNGCCASPLGFLPTEGAVIAFWN